MRKAVSKSIVLAALAALFLTLTAAASELGIAVVETDSLRLRSEPSTEAATVTYLLEATKVSVSEVQEGWYQVSYGEVTGYVAAEYVSYTPNEVVAVSGSAGEAAVINASSVNFRSGPSLDHQIIAGLNKGAQVTLLEAGDEWCLVSWNGLTGYVNRDFVTSDALPLELEETRGIVTGDCVNVRDIPSTEGGIVTKVYAGNIVELLGLENGWYSVSVNGAVGFICADYLREYSGSTSSAIGEEVAALALSYLGTPYAYGGASAKGFDCSGFTMYVFSQFGYSLPHSATSQWNDSGEYVERSDLQPGDLVLFCDPSRSNGKACSHVGIYIGNDEFVHASSGSSGKYVRISSLTEDYYNGYYKGAKRLG